MEANQLFDVFSLTCIVDNRVYYGKTKKGRASATAVKYIVSPGAEQHPFFDALRDHPSPEHWKFELIQTKLTSDGARDLKACLIREAIFERRCLNVKGARHVIFSDQIVLRDGQTRSLDQRPIPILVVSPDAVLETYGLRDIEPPQTIPQPAPKGQTPPTKTTSSRASQEEQDETLYLEHNARPLEPEVVKAPSKKPNRKKIKMTPDMVTAIKALTTRWGHDPSFSVRKQAFARLFGVGFSTVNIIIREHGLLK
jgi:hypothetical protein